MSRYELWRVVLQQDGSAVVQVVVYVAAIGVDAATQAARAAAHEVALHHAVVGLERVGELWVQQLGVTQ